VLQGHAHESSTNPARTGLSLSFAAVAAEQRQAAVAGECEEEGVALDVADLPRRTQL
jgi:hypothetical protein